LAAHPGSEIVDLRAVTKSRERDYVPVQLVDSAIVADSDSPSRPPAAKWFDVQAGARPGRVFQYQIERSPEAPLDLLGKSREFSLGAGLKENLRHWLDLESSPHIGERDVRLLMQPAVVLSPEPWGRDLLHQFGQHIIVGRIPDLVALQSPEGLRANWNRRRRCHTMGPMVSMVITLIDRFLL